MNRIIKFRVWDKLTEHMIYPHNDNQQHFIIDLNGQFHNLQNGSGGDDFVIQQYTGCHDSTKKEIYEGDLVHLKDELYIYEVVWNKWRWGIYSKGIVKDFIQGVTSEVEDRAIVMGNIYENPKLLS